MQRSIPCSRSRASPVGNNRDAPQRLHTYPLPGQMSLRLWQIVPDLATVDALAEPWQKLYAHSTVVATLVLFGHVAGLLVAGALTFSTEAGALRLDPADDGERRRYLRGASPCAQRDRDRARRRDGQRRAALPRRSRGVRGLAASSGRRCCSSCCCSSTPSSRHDSMHDCSARATGRRTDTSASGGGDAPARGPRPCSGSRSCSPGAPSPPTEPRAR